MRDRTPGLLHQLFEESARLHPERLALQSSETRLSYIQLERTSNRVAHILRARGFGRGDILGLQVERGAEVYVWILGILKAGAAYLPFDPGAPGQRVEEILADAGARGFITQETLARNVGARPDCRTIFIEQACQHLQLVSSFPVDQAPNGLTPNDLCYVIYTSGSTGRPKGVAVPHSAARAFVEGARAVYALDSTHRVYQGFSLAFDASVEELWMAFANGAALIVSPSDAVRSGAGLAEFLEREEITFFSTVPTLLSTFEGDLPTIRLLVLGGERCPQEIADRWATTKRRVLNTYGPTEATVVATWHDCRPGREVTIGRPLPSHEVYILDENLRPVRGSEPGELCISGPALARGYLNREELTRQKFVRNPFDGDSHATAESPTARLYRTGDVAHWTPSGEIQFVGRLDDQVKLRGFRIELGEIEAVLVRHSSLRSAVADVRDVGGYEHLVAWVVTANDAEADPVALLAHAKEHLPAHMLPTIFVTLDEIPRLTSSGKADRRDLPVPRPVAADAEVAHPEMNATERLIADVWARAFGVSDVSVDDDFFLDLGGHSLLAAQVVSALRQEPLFAGVALQQLYEAPTVRQLAARCEAEEKYDDASSNRQTDGGVDARTSVRNECSLIRRHRIFTLAQLAVVYGLVLVGFGVLLGIREMLLGQTWFAGLGPWQSLALLLVLPPIALPVSFGVALAGKWLLIGRFKPGRHPLWGLYHFRLWLVRKFQVAPTTVLAGTPLINLYQRLMGARVAPGVWLGTADVVASDLVSIGRGSSLGTDSHVRAFTVEEGYIRLGRIDIGEGCFVGTRCVLGIDTRLEDGARLEDQSMLPEGSVVPEGETWRGSPARPVLAAEADVAVAEPVAVLTGPFATLRYAAALLALGMYLAAIASPVVALIYGAIFFWGWNWLLWTPVVALLGVLSLTGGITLAKRVVLRRARAGDYPVSGGIYLRKWVVDTFLQGSLGALRCLYATLYVIPWLRSLGAKIGERVEVSTASRFSPDLLTAQEGSFMADASILGAARVEKGWLRLRPTHIGTRAFIGNSALVPAGARIGDRSLLGVMSIPPAGAAVPSDTDWLGSPSFALPHRQQCVSFPESTTYAPRRGLYLARLTIEAFRVLIPPTVWAIVGGVSLTLIPPFLEHGIPTPLLSVLPLAVGLASLAVALVPLALKWALIGRYRPTARPLWSTFVWRTELVTGVYETIAVPAFLSLFGGTPLASWYLRLLGCDIGKRVYLETTNFSEFDLVHVGDDAILGPGATMQTHLFEDRIMKTDHLVVGPRCTVGINSVVLYNTEMEADSVLRDLSLIAKGERFPSGTTWQGIPSRRCATVRGRSENGMDASAFPSEAEELERTARG